MEKKYGLPFVMFTLLVLSSAFKFSEPGLSNAKINLNALMTDFKDTIKDKEEEVVAEGAVLELISDQFKFTEGPAADKKGNVFFTDQPNNTIWKYSIDGKLTLFMENAGRSNGLYFDKSGNLIACADEKNELWSISPDKTVKVLLNDYEGKKLNGPNDIWIDDKGGIYFTDPYYQRDYWERKTPELDGEKLYYLPKGKTNPVILDDEFAQPNGIIGSPDFKYLFVADIGANKTYRYLIKGEGVLGEKTLFANQGSDGMTIDNKGNIYLTGNGVSVYNKEGKKIKQIDVPENWTGNVTFFGKNRDRLFITASKSVYLLKMNVRGVK